ncbi:MAG: hypothetical protein JWM68_2982 [Verrucomicrobiales bacterium]|nr:hypothetical protein [Verrucomicrobiales bacterium]
MKKASLILSALLLACVSTVFAADEVLTVAVFDFETKDESTRDLGPKIATLVNANLSAEPMLITVERAELQKALGEQELGLSGTVSTDTAAKVGHLTGAKVLVTGRAFKVEKDLIIVAKIISAETSRVFGEIVQGAPANVADLSAALAKKIAKVVTEKSEVLVAKVVSRDERIEKIIKSLKGDKRPLVSVNINERHFGGPVIDPAAQTELSVILQKAGFTLIDEKSDKKPEIEITGEAFSAYGMRKGNLISCRSRIEIKIHEKATGKLIMVDRQTSVAVDIAEQIAAKNALQNAAGELAERLLPKLTQ